MRIDRWVVAIRVGALLLSVAAVGIALYARRPEASTGLLAGAMMLLVVASTLAERRIRDERRR